MVFYVGNIEDILKNQSYNLVHIDMHCSAQR